MQAQWVLLRALAAPEQSLETLTWCMNATKRLYPCHWQCAPEAERHHADGDRVYCKAAADVWPPCAFPWRHTFHSNTSALRGDSTDRRTKVWHCPAAPCQVACPASAP